MEMAAAPQGMLALETQLSQLGQTKEDLWTLRAHVSQLEVELEALSERNRVLQQQLQRQQDSAEHERCRSGRLQEELDAMESEVHETSTQRDQLQGEVQHWKPRCLRGEARLSTLARGVELLAGSLQTVRDRLARPYGAFATAPQLPWQQQVMLEQPPLQPSPPPP